MSEELWKEFLEYTKTHSTTMSEKDLREYFNFMTGDFKTSMKDLLLTKPQDKLLYYLL